MSVDIKTLRQRLLVGGLVILVVGYVALLPTLRKVQQDTLNINVQTDVSQSQALGIIASKAELEQARKSALDNPNSLDAQLSYATIALNVGYLDAASQAVDAAKKLTATNPAIMILDGEIWQRRKKYAKAIPLYREALRIAPNQPRAVNGLSVIYLALGWTQPAREILNDAVRANPTDRNLRYGLALANVQSSAFREAEGLLLQLQRENPDDRNLWGPLVDVYLKSTRPQSALAVLEAEQTKRPPEKNLLDALSRAYLAVGNVDAAIKAATAGYLLEPGDVVIQYQLALCYLKRSDTKSALPWLEKVERQSPGFDKVRLHLGQILLTRGKPVEARRLLGLYKTSEGSKAHRIKLNLAVSMQGDKVLPHFAMAKLYQSEGNLDRAIIELRRTVELDINRTTGADILLAECERQQP